MDAQGETLSPDELLAQLGWVRALARSLVHDPEVTDDVLQQVCLLALQQAPREARAGPRLRAWLAAVTRSLAGRSARSDLRRRRRERVAAQPEALPSTADLAAHREALRQLVEAVTSLEEPAYSVIIAHYFDGRPVAEIAVLTGATPAAVRQRLSRGRQQLRARLQAQLDDDRHGWLRAALPLAPAALRDVGRRTLLESLGGSLVAKSAGGSLAKLVVGVVLLACLLVGTWLGLRERGRAEAPPAVVGPIAGTDGLQAGGARLPQPHAGDVGALAADGEAVAAAVPAAAPLEGEALHVTGRVLDMAQRPVAGAVVRHWPTASQRARLGLDRGKVVREGIPWDSLATARSGADGRFVLDIRDDCLHRQALFSSELVADGVFADVMEARPILVIEEPEHALTAVYVTAAQPGDVDVGDVVLQDGTIVVGRLLDPAGAPVAGLRVEVNGEGALVEFRKRPRSLLARRMSAVSDATGRFRLTGLWPGDWSLFALPAEAACLTQRFSVEQPGELDLGDVRLAAGGRLAGRVVDAQGAPVPGATIRVRPSVPLGLAGPEAGPVAWDVFVEFGGRVFDRDVHADETGAFEVPGLADWSPGYDVMASAEGFNAAWAADVSHGRDDLLLRLTPEAVWQLRFTAASSGERAQPTEVKALRFADQAGEWFARLIAEREGDDWLLHGASSVRTQVVVAAPGCAQQTFLLRGLAPGERREETLALVREALIGGTVVDDDGVPLAGAALHLAPSADRREALGPRDAVADAQGRFHFGGLDAGDWTIRATAAGCLPMFRSLPLTLAAAEVRETLELVLPRGATITGVLLGDGGPVSGERIHGTCQSPETIALALRTGQPDGTAPPAHAPRMIDAYAFTGSDGRFALAGLAPGRWEVDGGDGAEAVVDLAERQTKDVALARPQPPTVTGRVTLRGQPVAGALVELGYGPDIGNSWVTRATARTDAAGNYQLAHADANRFFLRASHGQSPCRPVPVELAWNRAGLVDLTLPTGRVCGRVVAQQGGGPLAGIAIKLNDPVVLQRSGNDPLERDTHTDADGRFTFEGVDGGTWQVVAGSDPYSSVMLAAVVGAEGEEPAELSVALELGGTVEVSLASVTGATAPLLVVLHPRDGQGGDQRQSALAGLTLRFTAIPPAEYELTVKRADGKGYTLVHFENVRVAPGEVLRVEVPLR